MKRIIELVLLSLYRIEVDINVFLAKLYRDGIETERWLAQDADNQASRHAACIASAIKRLIHDVPAIRQTLRFLGNPLPALSYVKLPAPGKQGYALSCIVGCLQTWTMILSLSAYAILIGYRMVYPEGPNLVWLVAGFWGSFLLHLALPTIGPSVLPDLRWKRLVR